MKRHNKNANILIVEDDYALNNAYSMILRSAGHTIETAYNGREALDFLAATKIKPDIILLDLHMPVLDGIGFLSAYKPVNHPETKVIVFSNYDTHRDIDKAYQLGIEKYILKARATPKDLAHLVTGALKAQSLAQSRNS